MLTIRSVEQILKVLKKFQYLYGISYSTSRSLQEAIHEVGKEYQTTYQNIEDLCRRRLGLLRIEDFHTMLDKWMSGKSDELANLLKRNTNTRYHMEINSFFNNTSEDSKEQTKIMPTMNHETFSLTLDGETAKKLHVLDLMGGIRASDWLSKAICEMVDKQYREWLMNQMKGIQQ